MPLIVLGFALAAAAPDASASEDIRVITSIPPLAMMVREIGGDHVEISTLAGGATTPHSYSPRPSDAAAVARADLVMMMGGGIDDWLADMVDAGSKATVLTLLTRASGAAHEASHGHEASHAGRATHRHDSGEDPHAWLDPAWTRDNMVPAIVRALSALDPPTAPQYEAQGRMARERLTNLEEDMRQMLSKATTRKFVAFHPAWGRFAARFDLEPLGAIQESGGEEPTVRSLVATMRAAKAAGLRAILIEPQMDARVARTLADELGAGVLTVDPFGDLDSFDRDTYHDLMMLNATVFAQALAVSAE